MLPFPVNDRSVGRGTDEGIEVNIYVRRSSRHCAVAWESDLCFTMFLVTLSAIAAHMDDAAKLKGIVPED